MKRRVASVDSAKPLNESESGTHTEEQEFSKYSGIFQSTPANQPSLPRKTRQTASMTTAPDSREGTTKDFIMGNLAKPSKRGSLVSTCVGCSKHITDPYILKVYPDLEWHAACLRCVECNQNLDESCTCFFREGKIYCKTDYCRKFSVRCAQCQAGLLSSDLVLRARGLTYHQRCFCCVACNRQLLPGDVFRLRLDGPYCIKDGGLPDTGSHQEGPLSSLADTGALYLSEKFKAYQARHAAKHPDKITRVRTVLNEQQLLTLRTCYAANPRPDALMKQQLIEMTGLSSRVIRVWFQNKRCKDKKKSVLQKHPDQCNRDKMDIRGLVGTLMVAMSPLPQTGDLQCSPIEVHRCHPPWEDLKDFTLQEGFSGGQSHSNCSSSEVSTLSSQLSDMLNSEESQPADL